ncbi:MAG: ferrous iron transport protein A [Chlorobi bacterium]|nr:ferrous iron transport protein A [Chlorobiota bacterium]
MCPLAMLTCGESAEIVGVRNGFRHHGGECVRHGDSGCSSGHHGDGRRRSARLSEMGFSPGQIVEVVQNSPGVPLLLRVRDGKMAVDKRTAMEIMVRRISS